jgi:hypothetical protein
VEDGRYICGRREQPRTVSDGGGQDCEHFWEAEEHSRKSYMRFPDRKSRNKCSRLPSGCGEEELELVEVSAPSEVEKSRGCGSTGHSMSYGPTGWKKNFG